jgi:hypothetical protein
MNAFKDQFDPDIEKELSLLEVVPPRDPESAASGRESFLTEARALTPPVLNHDGSRNWIGVLLSVLRGKHRSPAYAVLASIALVLVILLGGTGATVYAAQGSMPDQVLYNVKLLSEDLRLGLTSSSQAELALSFEMVERRIEEIVTLIEMGSDVPDSVVNRLEQNLDQSLNVVVDIEDDEVEPVMVQIQKHLRDQIQDYTQTKGQSQDGPKEGDWDRIRDMLQTNLDKVDAGIKDPEAFRHSYRNNTRHEYRYAEESEEEPVEEPASSGEGDPVEESGNTNDPGPQPVEPPDNGNGTGPQPEDPPGNTFGPGPAENADPEPSYGPGPQPEDPPADSSNGPGPQPTVTPAGYFYSPGLGPFNGRDSGSDSNGSSGKSP